jgi:MFS family permease
MVAMLVSFVDRQIIALVIEPMKVDLGINDTQAGWLYSGFALFYAIAGYPIAWLADRRNRKVIVSIGIFFWSIFTMACGLMRSFWPLFLARVGVGVGEATLTPCAHSMLGDVIPKHRIPIALAIFQGGAILGTGFAFMFGGIVVSFLRDAEPVILPYFGSVSAWQLAFVYVGAPGFLVMLLMMTIREPVRLASAPKKKTDRSKIVEFYASNWQTILFHHAGFMMLVVMGYAFVFWTPSFFERVHGIAAERASIIYGLTFIIAGAFGTASSAMLAQKLMAKGRRDALIVIAIAGAIGLVVTVLTIQLAQTALAAFLLYIPALVFLNVPFGLSFAALPIIAPPEVRAQVAAIYMLILSVGNALGPPLTGWLSDTIFTERDGILYSLVVMTSIFGTIGIALLWAGRHHFAKSVARSETSESSDLN